MEPMPPPLPDHDPYRAPASGFGPSTAQRAVAREIRLVGGGRRFLTYLVDFIGYFVLFVGLSFVVGIASVFVDGGDAVESTPDIVFTLASYVFYLLYYIAWEATTGRTPGKFVMGTIVVNEAGQRPSFGQCVGRSFARFIPFEVFSFFGDQSRGWHDSLAKTYVVSTR